MELITKNTGWGTILTEVIKHFLKGQLHREKASTL